MPTYYIAESKLGEFLFGLDAAAVFGQVADGEGSDFARLKRGSAAELDLRRPRAPTSVKSFLFPPKERVAVYPSASYRWQPPLSPEQPLVVAGIRACDVAALAILDSVFIQDDYVDPFYSLRREAMRVVSVDCAEPAPSCFCSLLGAKPYPQGGRFDVNLSPVPGGYVAEAGSEKGKEMLLAGTRLFREPTPAELAARDATRAAAEAKLSQQNGPFATEGSPQKIVAEAIEDDRWLELAAGCVECGSCSAICPTCHCFQLYDQPSDEAAGPNERIKTWDSCVLASYAKMAGVGGLKATPRPELRQRFANRVIHKFAWFPQTMGLLGCVGCGRCIDACLGGDDLRRLIKDLETVEA